MSLQTDCDCCGYYQETWKDKLWKVVSQFFRGALILLLLLIMTCLVCLGLMLLFVCSPTIFWLITGSFSFVLISYGLGDV